MLILMIPSLVSTMPWNPIRPLPPPPPPLPLLTLPLSLCALLPALSPPLLPGLDPHGMASLCMGLCVTGELCTLNPGLTARRLKLTGSRSLSSRRRLLLIRREISAAEGVCCQKVNDCCVGHGGTHDLLRFLAAHPRTASPWPNPH